MLDWACVGLMSWYFINPFVEYEPTKWSILTAYTLERAYKDVNI